MRNDGEVVTVVVSGNDLESANGKKGSRTTRKRATNEKRRKILMVISCGRWQHKPIAEGRAIFLKDTEARSSHRNVRCQKRVKKSFSAFVVPCCCCYCSSLFSS